jgi:hypothetical protein
MKMPETELEKMYKSLGPEVRKYTYLKGVPKVYRQAILDEFDREKSDDSWGLLYTIYRYLKGE